MQYGERELGNMGLSMAKKNQIKKKELSNYKIK